MNSVSDTKARSVLSTQNSAGTQSSVLDARHFRSTLWAIFWIALAAAGIALRVALASVSIGTNDAFTFVDFARDVRLFGVSGTYVYDPVFNHPPLVGLWSAALLKSLTTALLPPRVAYPIHLTYQFSFLFKLPAIAADAVGCWLLWRIWRPKVGPAWAAAIAAAFAWSLDAILVSGFHCNTDSIYVCLCLASAYALDRRAYGWAGLLLGAAINVKVIPLLLIAPMLLACPGRREMRLFVYGLAVCAIPFLPVLSGQCPAFYSNVLAYNSSVNAWGIGFFLVGGLRLHGLPNILGPVHYVLAHGLELYHNQGRYVVLAAIALWALLARSRRLWTGCELAAVTLTLFLVLAPGFGVQYTAAAGVLLFAVRPGLAMLYGAASGVFICLIYYDRLVSHVLPIFALFHDNIRPGESVPGFVAWAALVYFLITTVLRRRVQQQDLSQPETGSTNAPLPMAA